MRREEIRNSSYQIIGWLEHQDNGDIIVRGWDQQIRGYYKKSQNATTDFYGRILYYGNCASVLLFR